MLAVSGYRHCPPPGCFLLRKWKTQRQQHNKQNGFPSTSLRVKFFHRTVAAGIIFSIYTQAGYALAGVGVELDAIASVVIGGTL